VVKSSTKPGDLILDPFNGGGTTGIAAALLGDRNYVGIDITKDYLDLTIKKYKQLNNQPKLL
jgi:site-specific DNA-methyltransferase (adenine-specific)